MGVGLVDVGLVLTAVGTVAGCGGVAVAWWQAWFQARQAREERARTGSPVFGMSVAPPVGRLPAAVHGRAALLDELRGLVRRPPGVVVVVVGMGGIGKSTVAAELARQVARPRRRVWWITATDGSSLAAGLITVARELGATATDLQALASGAADAPDRFWRLLDRAPRGWLLVFDNADRPETLLAANDAGWLRPSRRGLIVVTSRHAGRRAWGPNARHYPVDVLDPGDATRVLHDLAPAAGDEAEAAALARRLAGVPLLLRLVGGYLGSDIVRWGTFTAYREALDSGELAELVGGSDIDPWAVLTRAWDVSLDDLAGRGLPQARPLLRLLSCYAPAVPIPLGLLDVGRLSPLLGAAGRWAEVERALNELSHLGLVEAQSVDGRHRVVFVRPAVADANRALIDRAAGGRASAPEPEPRVVRQVAVELVGTAVVALRWDEPEDWSRFALLGLHIRALLDSVAPRLDRPGLGGLLGCLAVTARALDQSGAIGMAERLCVAAEPHMDRLGLDHPSCLAIRHQRAWEIAFRGFREQAEELFREVWRARGRVLGADHRDTLATRHELGWIAATQGRWAEAEEIYREVLRARRDLLGPEDRATLASGFELAWVIARRGRLDEAEAMLRQVYETRGRVLGARHPHTLATRHELGWVAAMRDDLAGAEAIFQEVWEARVATLVEDHHDTLTTRHELAWVTARRGRRDEAERIYLDVLRARRRRLGEDHPGTRATATALEELRRGRIVDADHFV